MTSQVHSGMNRRCSSTEILKRKDSKGGTPRKGINVNRDAEDMLQAYTQIVDMQPEKGIEVRSRAITRGFRAHPWIAWTPDGVEAAEAASQRPSTASTGFIALP